MQHLGSDLPGTMVVDEEEIMAQGLEKSVVSGIAFAKDEAKITVTRVADRPGVAAAIFGPLAEANVNVDMIVQNVSLDGSSTDITFTVPRADLARAVELLQKAKADLKFAEVQSDTNVAKISVIGVGMRSHAGVALKMFETLAGQGDKHPGDLDLRDQDQRAGGRRIHRARGPRPAHSL